MNFQKKYFSNFVFFCLLKFRNNALINQPEEIGYDHYREKNKTLAAPKPN